MGHMAIVQDPGGAVFGLWQPLGHYGAAISHESGTMGWCEVNVPDAEQARRFYEELMGVTTRRLGTDEIPTTYYVLTKDGADVGGILEMNEAWEGVPPHWMAYFEVRDTDQTVEVAREAGGTVSVRRLTHPTGASRS